MTTAVAGEKKHITVLFADVAGSMDLQERLDAEVWAQIMGRFVSILAEGVRKYGGTVDKFTGDGIMALFGAPVAQEDHARRACHAAWHLTKAIAEYSQELHQKEGVELHVRLGLNSGEVVVGRVGDDVTIDPTALGHTVGLAQRMEAMAEPGKAYLTDHTARLAAGWFVVEDLGSVSVKGVREPVRVFTLAGPSDSMPLVHGAGLQAAPLVGRDRELSGLEDAITLAEAGHFQVVGVVGQAGVGKSRLCDEFAESLRRRGVTVRRAAGVSHARDVPLVPILAFYRDYFGITEADEPDEARRRVRETLLRLDPGLEDELPLIFDFLGVADPERPVGPMPPELRMRRVFEVVRRATARRSEREVLVLVFEDLHLFDPQSRLFLERLIETYPGSRTVVVTNSRPEFSAPWTRHSYYRQIALAPLQNAAVADLLSGLLGVDLSLAPLLGFVVERTGGNPFFVEEMVRALVEDGTLAGGPGAYELTRPLHDVDVPPSVQAVIAARIDRLPAPEKAVLHTAAVIGRTFSKPVLAHVVGAEQVDDALAALCAAELLQQVGFTPITTYRFWHTLTQEVAYRSLLTERRQALHGLVAGALIEYQPDRLDEHAGVISWHWERADRPLEAARWNLRAGDWAARSDLSEALRRWQAATELLGALEATPSSLELGVQVRTRLLRIGARHGMAEDQLRRLEAEGRAAAEQLGHPRLTAMLAMACGSARQFAGDLTAACSLYREAVGLAERDGDPELRVGILAAASGAFVFAGPLEVGLGWTEEVLGLSTADPDLGAATLGYPARTLALSLRCWYLCRMGRLPEAAACIDETATRARSGSELEALCFGLSAASWLGWLTGDGEDALPLAEEAVRVAHETGNWMIRAFGTKAVAIALLANGHATDARTTCLTALRESRESRAGLQIESDLVAFLARANLAAGDAGAALQAADEAVLVARRRGAGVGECFALLTRAHVHRVTGAPHTLIVADLEAAAALVPTTGAASYQPFIQEELGRLHDDEAQLHEALRLYQKIGATGHARRLEAELSARVNP